MLLGDRFETVIGMVQERLQDRVVWGVMPLRDRSLPELIGKEGTDASCDYQQCKKRNTCHPLDAPRPHSVLKPMPEGPMRRVRVLLFHKEGWKTSSRSKTGIGHQGHKLAEKL